MSHDVIVIGAGHNGLTAAAYLARAGKRVLVLESADHPGGATVSAQAFPGHDARLSRYSYLISLLPSRIRTDLELDLKLVRRRYASYTPVPGDPGRGLLVDHADPAATAASFRAVTGEAFTRTAWTEFYGRMAAVASALFPTVLSPLLSRQAMRDLCGDHALFDALTQRPLGELIRAVTDDDTVRGVIATDALIGTFASLDDPSLRQNICFLYHLIGGGTGDWDVPVGGMGAFSDALLHRAVEAGADIRLGARALAVDPEQSVVTWTQEGEQVRGSATHILCAAAPAVLNTLLDAAHVPPVPTEPHVEGAQLKVNMLLTRLPRLRDGGVDPAAAFAGTFHINEGYSQLEAAWADAESGRVPGTVPCEIYCHTLSDRSILGPQLAASQAQTLTLFGLHLPARLFRADNDGAREQALRATLDSLNSVLAEPIQDVLALDAQGRPCLEAKTPLDVEAATGMPGGNIFHRSLQWPWAEREDEVGTWGVETPYENVLVAGAGARRGGGVSGISGHNAAMAVLGERG